MRDEFETLGNTNDSSPPPKEKKFDTFRDTTQITQWQMFKDPHSYRLFLYFSYFFFLLHEFASANQPPVSFASWSQHTTLLRRIIINNTHYIRPSVLEPKTKNFHINLCLWGSSFFSFLSISLSFSCLCFCSSPSFSVFCFIRFSVLIYIHTHFHPKTENKKFKTYDFRDDECSGRFSLGSRSVKFLCDFTLFFLNSIVFVVTIFTRNEGVKKCWESNLRVLANCRGWGRFVLIFFY